MYSNNTRIYEFFSNSSQYQCLYNHETETILELNKSMKSLLPPELESNTDFKVEFVYKTETEKFISFYSVPCKLKRLMEFTESVCIMEMFPANTNTWRKLSNTLLNVMDLTSDGIWEWYPKLKFEFMSERFWSILGQDHDKMGESPDEWVDMLDKRDVDMVMKTFKEHVDSIGEMPYRLQVRYQHKEGHTIVIFCRGLVTEWLPNGEPWKMMGTHTDVTTIVQKDALEAQSIFISRMSHEIRSPVCTIINECELLEMGNKTAVILDTCKQLISITDNILSLRGGLDGSDNILCPVKTDIEKLISRSSKRHRLSSKDKGINLRTSIGDLPEYVMVDCGKFNQVLDNLLTNSIKYTISGKIAVDVEYINGVFEIRVIDTGIGISDETDVFEEFVQGNDSMNGVGIGLTLARKLSRAMGGDLIIESSSDKGTTMLFTCVLPLYEEDKDKQVKPKKEFNVLIVDDMATNITILKRRLSGLDIQFTSISEAMNGKEAVDIFKQNNGNYQLVLMDCLMPILDGFGATIAIHNECERMGLEPVPVVAVTASVSPQLHTKCFDTGMKYVVTKPYSEKDLLNSIQSCIGI